MKSLPLKLGIGIVIVFGFLMLGFVFQESSEWKLYEEKLCSDDKAARDEAIKTIASKGEKVIPYIRTWLKTENDKLITGACFILEQMEGDIWKRMLPELTEILHQKQSRKTDSAARLVYKRGYACLVSKIHEIDFYDIKWKHFKSDNKAKINICLWMLSGTEQHLRRFATVELGKTRNPNIVETLINVLLNDSDHRIRMYAALALGKTDDDRIVNPLIKALGNDSDEGVRMQAASELGKIGDVGAVEPLIKALENDSDRYVRETAATALGNIRDNRAIEPLVRVLMSDSVNGVRGIAARALGKIGNTRAVEPLIKALEKDSSSKVRWRAAGALGDIGDVRALKALINKLETDSAITVRMASADALGKIGDLNAIEPLIKAMRSDSQAIVRWFTAEALMRIGNRRAAVPFLKTLESDSDIHLRIIAAVAVARFKEINITNALKVAAKKKNQGAIFALAWRQGGEYLNNAMKVDISCSKRLFSNFRSCALSRWGILSSINKIIDDLPDNHPALIHYYLDVFSRMPEGSPAYDFKANYATRERQAKAMKAWYDKHKHRLAWNPSTRKYYLKPEETK